MNCRGLKSLDLSKNVFSRDSMANFLSLLSQGSASGRPGHVTSNLGNLQSLNLANVTLHRDCQSSLVSVVGALRQLKRLDISGIQLGSGTGH